MCRNASGEIHKARGCGDRRHRNARQRVLHNPARERACVVGALRGPPEQREGLPHATAPKDRSSRPAHAGRSGCARSLYKSQPESCPPRAKTRSERKCQGSRVRRREGGRKNARRQATRAPPHGGERARASGLARALAAATPPRIRLQKRHMPWETSLRSGARRGTTRWPLSGAPQRRHGW